MPESSLEGSIYALPIRRPAPDTKQVGRQIEKPLQLLSAGLQRVVYSFVVACGAKKQFQGRHHPLAQALHHRLRQVGGHEQRADLGCTVVQRNCEMALVGRNHLKLQLGKRQPQHLSQPVGGLIQGRAQVARVQHQPGQLGREVGLLAALVGVRGARSGHIRQRADQQRNDEEGTKYHPVSGLPRGEAPVWRDMEPVEGQGADDRRRRRQPEPPSNRYHHDAEQIDHAQGVRGGHLLERIQQQGLRHNEHHGDHEPQSDRRGRRAQQQ